MNDPRKRLKTWMIVAMIACGATDLLAAPPVEAKRGLSAVKNDSPVTAEVISAAIARSLPLIETSAAEYRRQRQCFSCHHQAMSVLALVEARDRGFKVDEQKLAAQIEHTTAHLKRGEKGYREARGQGGQIDTAGWALWTLEVAEHSPDEMTAAAAHYVLNWQNDLGHWKPSGRGRRPTQGSDFTATYLALRGLTAFATPEQAEQVAERTERVKTWLAQTAPTDTEDRVYQLRALSYTAVDSEIIDAAANDLLGEQHEDGGWSQTPERESDAYATGTVLVALHETGMLKADDPAYQRGLAFLLKRQLTDGSWKVTTRAKPIQVYFESGFPHEKDQFISMAATCWATIALLKSCAEASHL